MVAIVVPFRAAGKQRLDAPEEDRSRLALAMLADVLTACVTVAPTRVVTADPDATDLAAELGADVVDDPGGGQGPAVASALAGLPDEPVLVVNADVPCVLPRDLRVLARAAELGALGLVEAEDGTTNAVALPTPGVFAPLYGPGSAERFREHAKALGLAVQVAELPNLGRDVDTTADLERVGPRAGRHTRAALAVVAAR